MLVELTLAALAGLVGDVTGLTSHVERRVTAAVFGNVGALRMAAQAEVVFLLVAGGRLQQLILVGGRVRIVALDAVSHRRGVDRALNVGRFLVRVTGDANTNRRGSNQLDAGDVFIHPDLVAGCATHGDRGVDVCPFGFLFMALQTSAGIRFRIEWDRMCCSACACRGENNQQCQPGERPSHSCNSTICDCAITLADTQVARYALHRLGDERRG